MLQRLADENRLVFLIGPGGSGKGTLIRLLVALIGSTGVFTVPNVSRLVSSPFATSQLDMAALLVVSDPTDTARRQNRDALSDGADHHQEPHRAGRRPDREKRARPILHTSQHFRMG